MKQIITAALLGIALTGCKAERHKDFEERPVDIVTRLELVKACPSGLVVGRDPETGDLYLFEQTALAVRAGRIQPGITAAEVC